MASFILRKKKPSTSGEERGGQAAKCTAAAAASGGGDNGGASQNSVYGACNSVFDYERIDRIGEGTFGLVYKARHKVTGDIVALKRVILHNENSDGFPLTSLREIMILKRLSHPNIVNLLDVVVGAKRESVFLCFEYCQTDLASILDSSSGKSRKRASSEILDVSNGRPGVDASPRAGRLQSDASRTIFSEPQVKAILLQLLKAVAYMHENWTVHRDIKMSNLLYNKGLVKLADFGLAREVHYPSEAGDYTTRVVTLWYRAPELLLGTELYDVSIDMWSVGCIFAELLLGVPLFNGNVESEQIERIFSILGSPNGHIWKNFEELPMVEKLRAKEGLFSYRFNRLPELLPNLSEAGLSLLNSLLSYDPRKRISAHDALKHPYFEEYPGPSDREEMPSVLTESDKSLVRKHQERSNKERLFAHTSNGGTRKGYQ
eukprot:gb/GECG01014578.1/.p1 GENE.gb/GECG01014578.1/~~gb/GECG01014578.1/.p1  ORF type:complete len:432 (+),score=44.78 gb/GECG01014578.1/:1-1296(+)